MTIQNHRGYFKLIATICLLVYSITSVACIAAPVTNASDHLSVMAISDAHDGSGVDDDPESESHHSTNCEISCFACSSAVSNGSPQQLGHPNIPIRYGALNDVLVLGSTIPLFKPPRSPRLVSA